MGIENRAMLVKLSVSQYSGRKLDRAISKNVEGIYRAKEGAGNWTKHIVPKNALEDITKAVSAIRIYHCNHALPWNKHGKDCEWIISSDTYFDYTRKMGGLIETFKEAVYKFAEIYQNIKDEAPRRMGDMYDPKDFLSIDEIMRKFDVRLSVYPLPLADDWRVTDNLDEEEVTRIKQTMTDQFNESVMGTVKELWKRVGKAVGHVAEILSNDKSKIYDSLIGNLIDLVEILPKLNLTDDQNLENARRDIETKLCSVNPDVLRDNKTLRHKTKKIAEEIMDNIAPFVGVTEVAEEE